MQTCKTISENDRERFEDLINGLLEQGYKVSSSSCSTVNQKDYEAWSSIYQAILIKDE